MVPRKKNNLDCVTEKQSAESKFELKFAVTHASELPGWLNCGLHREDSRVWDYLVVMFWCHFARQKFGQDLTNWPRYANLVACQRSASSDLHAHMRLGHSAIYMCAFKFPGSVTQTQPSLLGIRLCHVLWHSAWKCFNISTLKTLHIFIRTSIRQIYFWPLVHTLECRSEWSRHVRSQLYDFMFE